MYFLLERIRPYLDEPITWEAMAINQSSAVAVIALGFYKHYKSKQQQVHQKPVVKSV